jgi:hypothetical protein
MHAQIKEGLPIWGELYRKQAMIRIRLEEFGAKCIQQEINALWEEITLRADVLSEPPLKLRGTPASEGRK